MNQPSWDFWLKKQKFLILFTLKLCGSSKSALNIASSPSKTRAGPEKDFIDHLTMIEAKEIAIR